MWTGYVEHSRETDSPSFISWIWTEFSHQARPEKLQLEWHLHRKAKWRNKLINHPKNQDKKNWILWVGKKILWGNNSNSNSQGRAAQVSSTLALKYFKIMGKEYQNSGGGGRWEGGSGWGPHVNPWLSHFNVWKNPLQIKINKKKRNVEREKKKEYQNTSRNRSTNGH